MADPAESPMLDDLAAERPARLGDLVGLGRLFLTGLAFWTAMAFVFAGQIVLLQLGTSDPRRSTGSWSANSRAGCPAGC
jgi:hypothetical protein